MLDFYDMERDELKKASAYFSAFEAGLWLASVTLIIASFFAFGGGSYLVLTASIIGASLLILNAKGNVIGQVLTVIFSILYGIISYSSAYYGEMVTYLGMTAPIAAMSVVTWLRNPSEQGRNEVKVNRLRGREFVFLGFLSACVTAIFYFILKFFGTAQLILSTLSIFTSFVASYLTMRRCEYFAAAYAANDAVLIALWSIASAGSREYFSMVICFIVFLVNDIYGFYSWAQMKKRQGAAQD